MFDPANLRPDVVQEIIREAEARLSAQLQTALAADQRSMTFAAIAGSASAAAIAGAGGLFFVESLKGQSLFYGALALSVVFFAASLLAALSARPADWEFVGNVPSAWVDDVTEGKSLKSSLAEMAEHYDGMILNNRKSMVRSAKLFKAALWLAVTACPTAIATAALFYFFCG